MGTSRLLKYSNARLFEGSSEEAREQLAHNASEHTIVLSVPDKLVADAFVAVLDRANALVPEILEARRRGTIDTIIEALIPSQLPSSGELKQAKMAAEARTRVIESGQFVTAADIAKLAGYSLTNPSAAPSRWKKDRQVFSITHKGIDYFPLFALNPDDNYRPFKAVGQILAIFGELLSAWGIASWFLGLNSFLDDQTPTDLLTSDPDWVVEAARDAVGEMAHA
jgi:hypothetical protein